MRLPPRLVLPQTHTLSENSARHTWQAKVNIVLQVLMREPLGDLLKVGDMMPSGSMMWPILHNLQGSLVDCPGDGAVVRAFKAGVANCLSRFFPPETLSVLQLAAFLDPRCRERTAITAPGIVALLCEKVGDLLRCFAISASV